MKNTMMTIMKQSKTHELINELAKECTLDKTVRKNKIIDTDGVPFVFIDNDGDEKIFNRIGFSSTKITREPCSTIGLVANYYARNELDIIKNAWVNTYAKSNITATSLIERMKKLGW